jgi:RNA polymerase sigma-70 factor (sigma-E family)
MGHRPNDEIFAALVRNRGGALTASAYLLTGDLPAAEDLVQDALLKVFVRTRSGFTPEAAEAYVRRAIVTLYVDGYRRRRHWGVLRHLLAGGDVGEGPEDATAHRMDLRAALGTLAPQERACVVLRFYEDLTVPEIAARMGISAGSVKRYLSNATTKLETRLGAMPTVRADASTSAEVVAVRPVATPYPARS